METDPQMAQMIAGLINEESALKVAELTRRNGELSRRLIVAMHRGAHLEALLSMALQRADQSRISE